MKSMRIPGRATLPVLALVLAPPTAAIPQAGADAGEPLVVERIVDAPPAEVWRLLFTAEGMKSWMVAHAEIDLRVGGLVHTNYYEHEDLDGPHTIVNRILSYEPERMLSMRVHEPPAGFPFPDLVREMWTVFYLEPLSDGRTRVRTVGLGYPATARGDSLRGFFAAGNAWTLEQLGTRASGESFRRTAPVELLEREK